MGQRRESGRVRQGERQSDTAASTLTSPQGRLILAGAPLGNPDDASNRLRQVLATADVIAAEDTRRLRRLAADLGVAIRGRVGSYYDSVEAARVPALTDMIAAGQTVVLISDGGMPIINDPGYRLVDAVIQAGLPVTVFPGPSAVTAALAVSGLPAARFCFEGFLPRKAGERDRAIAGLAAEQRTMVFLESPHRLRATLLALVEGFGSQRAAAICRELTKTYEEVVRGSLTELESWAQDGVRGEVTLVVAGVDSGRQHLKPGGPGISGGPGIPGELAAAVARLVASGLDKKSAIAAVARGSGVQKRRVYQEVLEAGQAGSRAGR